MPTDSIPRSWTGSDLGSASLLDGVLGRIADQPNDEALVDDLGAWSYAELFATSMRVARALSAMGPAQSRTFLVVADRSRRSVAAAFGALLAGGRYCLIDASYPAAALTSALRRLEPRAVLSWGPDTPAWTEDLPAGIAFLRADDLFSGEGDGPESSPDPGEIEDCAARIGRGAEIAFYTFTSGTTGVPKILAMSHAGYADVIRRLIEDYRFTRNDRVAVQSGFMFDAIWDVLTALTPGGAAIVLADRLYEDGRAWARCLRRHRATSLMSVPAALQFALESLPAGTPMPRLRQLILTGDRISGHVLRLIRRNVPAEVEIHNCYGVAEVPYILTGRVDPERPETATVFAMPDAARVDLRFSPVSEAGRASTLEAVSAANAHVVPIMGHAGRSLQVKGHGVFSGYICEGRRDTGLSLPTDAAGYFDTGDAFRQVRSDNGERLFGWRLVGRIDRRLNWQGYRIEPEEIETAFESLDGVLWAKVELGIDGRLICYVSGYIEHDVFIDLQSCLFMPRDALDIRVIGAPKMPRKVR